MTPVPRHKQKEEDLVINAITLDDDPTSYTSDTYDGSEFQRGALLIRLLLAGSPTDVVFSVEQSTDNTYWFKMMDWYLGDLRYEDTAGGKTECVEIPYFCNFYRVSAVATGTTSENKFIITCRMVKFREVGN